jgi:hypothetical protein
MQIVAAATLGLACLGAYFMLGRQTQVSLNLWRLLVFLLLPFIGFWSLTAAGLQLYAGLNASLAGQIGPVGGAVLGAALGLAFGLFPAWQFNREARTGDEKMGGYLAGCVLLPIHIVIGAIIGPLLIKIIN